MQRGVVVRTFPKGDRVVKRVQGAGGARASISGLTSRTREEGSPGLHHKSGIVGFQCINGLSFVPAS